MKTPKPRKTCPDCGKKIGRHRDHCFRCHIQRKNETRAAQKEFIRELDHKLTAICREPS
jgi:hypothetical protein